MQKAVETGTKMDIAVVDAGGNLKAFARMDGAWLGSHRHLDQEGAHGAVLRHAHR